MDGARRSSSAQRAHRPDYQLLLYAGLLMLLGLVIMYAIGPQRAQLLNSAAGEELFSNNYFVVKQLVSLVLALAVMLFMIFFPLNLLKKYAGAVFAVGIGLSAILFIFGSLGVSAIAQCSLGACRWFNLGPLGSFQPAELLKFGVLIFFARILAAQIKAGRLNDWKETILPLVILALVALFFVGVLQKDLGTGIALVSIMASMLFVAGINWRNSARLLIGAAIIGVLLIVMAPHRIERVMTFFRADHSATSSNALDSDYQIRHAKIAIGSGGLTGVGIGNSVEATGYLPEAINDSLFAILGETFGFLGLTAIIGVIGALLLRVLRVSGHSPDNWMKLVAGGVFGWLTAHTVLNIASMVGFIPLTGITLPLLSFGGTSMLFMAGAIGLVFHISRFTSRDIILEEEVSGADISRRRRVGWSRDTSHRRITGA